MKHILTAVLATVATASIAPANAQTYTRTDVTTYHDNLSKWVVGQPKSSTNIETGLIESRTVYDSVTALPLQNFAFEKLQQAMSYNADGTLATTTDGNSRTTSYTDWKRGIPQKVAFADTTFKSAYVNNSGWIEWVEDENRARTCYGYDSMGRVNLITYPSEAQLSVCNQDWLRTTISFAPSATPVYGLAANHWRRTESTGNARKITYYDAMWRPAVREVYDIGNTWNTITQTVTRYDSDGRPTFASYAQRSADPAVYNTWANPSVNPNALGIWTAYDPLGRPAQVQQNSEHGLLTTTTEYLSGFQTRTTNARDYQTVVQYQAFDQPSTDAPSGITSLGGANATEIYRDVFGKPTRLKRRNSDGTLSSNRYYVYDSHQQLCKSIEPESGTTLYRYDNAGNLTRTDFGMPVWPPSPCDEPAGMAALNDPPQMAPYAARAYDVRNRLQTLSFPDGRGNQSWEYWPDGLAKKITTYNETAQGSAVENNYVYNRRRMLISESQAQPGQATWNMGYTYSTNGALASLSYPGGLSVNYAPNAIGQPTQAGSYATGVSYYPNGGMHQFTYGNGIVHTMTQNTRQLPDQSIDSGGGVVALNDSYDYDFNGNVAAISDGLPNAPGNRVMSYDGLDRLTATTSPMFPGGTLYEYDALDNLTRVKAPGRDHYYCYDPTTWRLTNVKTGGCSGATVIGLNYDTQGNLAWKNNQDYEFDYGNRLRNVPNKESYRYDGYGRRVSAAATTGTIYSLYGQDGVLRRQRDERKAVIYDYITLNGSLVARVTDPTAVIGVPILTVPTLSDGNYTVQWTAVTGATRYELEEAFNGGGAIALYSGTAVSLPQSGKAVGTYVYRVRACKNTLCGNLSAPGTVVAGQAPTSAPILTAPAVGPSGNYSVSWTAVTAADSYVLEEKVGGTWSQAYSGALLGKTYGSKPIGDYGYQVKACNIYGCSAPSATKTVQVVYPPSAPTLSVPASSHTGSYTVSWTASSGATHYLLHEAVNGNWNVIQNSAATNKAFSGKTDGDYTYMVEACNTGGCRSSFTSAINVLMPPVSAPTVTAPANSYTGAYTVSWTAVPKANSYTLNMSVDGAAGTNIYGGAGLSHNVGGQGTAGYTYRVLACNGAGCAAWSTPVTTQVTLVPAMPASLTGYTELDPDLVGSRYFYVNWSAVPGATYYELTKGGIGGGVQNTTGTFFTTSGKGTRTYSVRACNPAGCSASKGPLTL